MNKPFRTEDENMPTSQAPFFRAADRLRLEGYIAAITQEGMSLSLLSTHEAILDHYSKLLVARLRQIDPDIALEVYFPASSEALLARFNEALSNCSIQEAMEGKGVLNAPKIWIVHDASALPDHEIQLLARLVQNFPGANIRVVLLMTVASHKQKLLTSFGRRIMCWDIEPPTPEQAENMLAQARADGREAVVSTLLKKIALPIAAPPEAPKVAAPSPPVAEAIVEKAPEKKFTRSSGINRGRLLLVILSLLFVSLFSVAAFHVASQGLDKFAFNWKALLSGKNPLLAESVPIAPAASSALAPAPALLASAPLAPEPMPVASAPVPEVVALPKPKEPIEVILPSTPEPIKVAEPVKRPLDVEPAAETVVGQAWVKKMPRGTFLVQHVALPTNQEAVQWIQRHPNLKNAHVVATYLPNQKATQYAIVSGPFSSLIDATSFVENGGIPKDPMIRSARYMKEQFTPELADADAKKRKENRR
jgi:hypothetical protein